MSNKPILTVINFIVIIMCTVLNHSYMWLNSLCQLDIDLRNSLANVRMNLILHLYILHIYVFLMINRSYIMKKMLRNKIKRSLNETHLENIHASKPSVP